MTEIIYGWGILVGSIAFIVLVIVGIAIWTSK